jgi:hypothetical protein
MEGNMRRSLPFFAAAVFLLCWTTWAAAQQTVSVRGHVLDRTGAVLAGARITAKSLETGSTRAATTGDDGWYTLPALPPGNYEIRAEYGGFRPAVIGNLRFAVGDAPVLHFTLEVGSLDQVVSVQSSAPLVNVLSPELGYLVSEETIKNLPLNGRNYTDLALLQPGVIAFPHRDGGSVVAHGLATSINGQDPRANVYLIDGTPQNDFTNGPAGSAAGTALGMEAIREFRVEVNNYSAEFGRNSGGQINVLTKSGSNDWHGSLYHYFRNDNFDARNFFDPAEKPEFVRNQFGVTAGGPARRDRSFFFLGYEGLRERLGRTISTVVPDGNARLGILPSTANPCVNAAPVAINAAVLPYLNEFPTSSTLILTSSGCPTGLASYAFRFNQGIDQDFGQFRWDENLGADHQAFARYTYDGAEQALPTDFPQFPRAFVSRNQFFTASYQGVLSASLLHNFRFGFSRTRVGQRVEANTATALTPFVPGRIVGAIDIAGIPRFGPQTSVNVQLVQNVFGVEYGLTQTRARHLLKYGMLVERYQDNLFNPTFSLGIFTFGSLRSFLLGTPARFLGLPPNGALDRYWRFTLFGFYVQDSYRIHRRLTLNAGLRYEFTTMPVDIYGRDSALPNLLDPAPTVGQLYQNPTHKNFSPRVGLSWDLFGNGKTSLRSGYGWFFNTNNHQNLIVTITNPPATPRVIISNPGFPQPNFAAGVGNSIRPVQFDIQNPNVHVWNLNVQQQFWGQTFVMLGYAGSRGVHLWRNGDVNTPMPLDASVNQAQCFPGINPALLPQFAPGTPCYPAAAPRPNAAFSTIELKRSDGNSWYNAMIFEVRKQWRRDLHVQSSYTWSRNIDTTQASTFFSDATNGSVSTFPESPGFENYNKGLADYHAKHNWVFNLVYHLPFARGADGWRKATLSGWQVAGIGTVRSGTPLTLFVQSNISRSKWSPSIAPGQGFDRPNVNPGFTSESAIRGLATGWFDPAAFSLPFPGTLGNLGRGALIGPNLRTLDFSLTKNTGIPAWGREANLEFRVEAFNLFNRTNLGIPSLIAFGGNCGTAPGQLPFRANGTCSDDAPVGSLGRIRQTVTSSRQIQLGLRFSF